jgi:HEAT repeat protein
MTITQRAVLITAAVTIFSGFYLIALRFAGRHEERDKSGIESSLVAELTTSLRSSHPSERIDAARRLGELRAKEGVPSLIKVIKYDPAQSVRSWAAWALGEIGDPLAVEPLIQALVIDEAHLKDENSSNYGRVITSYCLALKKLTGKDHGFDSAKWQEWWQEAQAEERKANGSK